MADNYLDILADHTDHASDWNELVIFLRQYASEGNADYARINKLADLIEKNLKGNEGSFGGSGPLFIGVVYTLIGLDDVDTKYKKIVKRLVDAV